MSSDSLAMKLVSRPARGASFLFAAALASVVFAAVTILWLVLLFLFGPFLLLSQLLGWPRKYSHTSNAAAAGLSHGGPVQAAISDQSGLPLVFDRRSDVSKLFGCNTRSVQYRWDIFSKRLAEIKTRGGDLHALDFGAGSLRDSYELIRQGFRVVSMDLDPAVMKQYFDSYDWTNGKDQPELFTESIVRLAESVGRGYFDLVISFDVIEHLERPDEYLRGVQPLLQDHGYLFAIVPNRLSVYERYFKYSLRKQVEKGAPRQPGVPHLQFKSPAEWADFIAANGFEIVEHDMAIGPLVNDLWHGTLGLPIRVFVAPVLARLAYALRVQFNAVGLEESFTPRWLMGAVDVWDQILKPHSRNRFGWNLIVARRRA